MLVNDLQHSNTRHSMRVTELGMVMLFNAQPQKALAPILVTEFGMVILASELHPQKAPSSITVTEFGSSMLVNKTQRLKAYRPM